ncbi:glycosyltransferase family 2 protein, partial [Hymenobacter defluvii]|nr:glycosyltransferase family 2 protein [Hymenobacter defluvii]
MSIVLTVLSLVLYAIGVFLLLNVLYLLFFALAGHWRTTPQAVTATAVDFRRMCVLIPAYQSDAVILETAPAAQQHTYAGTLHVQVIADGLQPTTVQA